MNDPHPPSSTERADVAALAGAALTALGHVVSTVFGFSGPFVVGACALWLAFFVRRARRDPRWLREWGLRLDGLARAARAPFAFAVVAAAALALYAAANGRLQFPPHALFCLLLYPVWGIIQQVLVLGVVVGNLEKLAYFRAHRVLLVALGAALFGAVHLPDLVLVAGTTGLALLYVPHFLRYRHALPLGIVHGWIGTLFYLWVLGRDPWLELFGNA